VAHVFTKFAVSIFAGGVVFATLLPEVSLHLGGTTFNSFWIGSVAVLLLTGLYTVLGGMRAVAYTDALQTFVLIAGSGLLTLFGLAKLGGWHELRRVLDPDLFNLWKPIVPAGMEGSWAPVKETGRIAWYFNGNYQAMRPDRKSTRLNSSHLGISYAVFCLKKKKKKQSERANPDHTMKHAN